MQENKIKQLFDDYFSLYTPSLAKGIALLTIFLEQGLKKGELDLIFNLFSNEIAPYLQENSSTEEKAEIFRLVLFDKLHFEIEPLKNEKQLSLKQVIRTRKTTPMFMGVLYLLLAQNFNTPAFLALSKGQVLVCFRHEYNFPNVYIDVASKGIFTTEKEKYLSPGSINISNENFQILTTKQIIRHLLFNLIYLYTKQNSEDKKQKVQSFLAKYL